MSDAADPQSGFVGIGKVLGVAQQQGLGKGRRILRETPGNGLPSGPGQGLGQRPKTSCSRDDPGFALGTGRQEHTSAGTAAGSLAAAGQGDAQAEGSRDPVPRPGRGPLRKIDANTPGFPVNGDGSLRTVAVAPRSAVLPAEDLRFLQRSILGKQRVIGDFFQAQQHSRTHSKAQQQRAQPSDTGMAAGQHQRRNG